MNWIHPVFKLKLADYLRKNKNAPVKRIKPNLQDIRELAYLKWEQAQPSNKSSEDFWLEAEKELIG